MPEYLKGQMAGTSFFFAIIDRQEARLSRERRQNFELHNRFHCVST